MSSSNKTELGLNLWLGGDKPKREDFCNDNFLWTEVREIYIEKKKL